MNKMIYYINKSLKKIVIFGPLLFAIFILTIIPVTIRLGRNNVKQQENIVNNKRLFKDLENLTEEEAFPKVNLSENMITEENKKYLKDNFLFFNFDNNESEKVAFNVLLPKYLNFIIEDKKTQSPFNATDKGFISIAKMDSKNSKIVGNIYVLNTTLELNANTVNSFMANKFLGLSTFKVKVDMFVDGLSSDILAISNDGKVSRIKTIKNSSLYYIISMTFDDFYDYLKHAKDVSIIFSSFTLTNRLSSISPIEFNILTGKNFEMLYPKSWKPDLDVFEKEDKARIFMPSDDNRTIFDIMIYNNTKKSDKELMKIFIDDLERRKVKFDTIREIETINNDEYDFYSIRLVNAKNKNDVSIDVYISVISKGNKKILVTFFTTNMEKDNYFAYHENERLLSIFINSISETLFNNIKINDTKWKYLVEN